jgi:hypothetical protein
MATGDITRGNAWKDQSESSKKKEKIFQIYTENPNIKFSTPGVVIVSPLPWWITPSQPP